MVSPFRQPAQETPAALLIPGLRRFQFLDNYQTVFINYFAVCQHDTLCYGVVGVVVLIPLYAHSIMSLRRPKETAGGSAFVPCDKMQEKINGKLILSEGERAKLYIRTQDVKIVCEGDKVKVLMT